MRIEKHFIITTGKIEGTASVLVLFFGAHILNKQTSKKKKNALKLEILMKLSL